MVWLLVLASPVVALLGWLWSRRYRPIGGSTLVVGRIQHGELDPRPSHLEVELGGGRRVRVQLGEAPLEARWPRRAALRPGGRVAIEALSVEIPREEAGYRENAQSSRLEAARVWLGSPPSRSRWPIALSLLPLLGAGVLRSRETPVELTCPAGRPRIVARVGGGWLGTCTRKGLAHGPWVEVDQRGTHLIEGVHCDGERCGHWAWRDVTGARVKEGAFVAGKRSGLWTFYDAGKKQSQGHFQADLQVGLWHFVHPSGREWRERFEDGWQVWDGTIP